MKYDVFIEYVDDVYFKIHAVVGIREQISDIFKFRIPNYQFHPKYKAGLWDGYIKLFNQYTCLMKSGLLKELLGVCKRYNYSIGVDPRLTNYDNITKDGVLEWWKNDLMPTNSDGNPLDVRDYQSDAISKCLKFRRLLLESATSSGKSAIIYATLKYLFQTDKIGAALIIVPTLNLIHQMHSDFDEYSQHDENDFSSDEWIHKLYSGTEKWSDKPIFLCTWQSAFKMPQEWFDQFDCFIGDEAHGCEAKSLVKISESLKSCPYKIGMTGSLKDFQGSLFNLQGMFGPVVKVISAKEMINSGYATKLKINGIVLEYSQTDRKFLITKKRAIAKDNKEKEKCGRPRNSSGEYKSECDFIVNHNGRQNFIKNLAVSLTGNSLVLFRFEDHGLDLFDRINNATPDDRPVFYVSGKIKSDVREKIRKMTEKYDNAIIVASYGTFSTGINIKKLHHLILAFPSKSKIKIVQSIGRILRKASGKTIATLWDICDDLQWKSSTNYSKDQFVERLKIYRNEKHPYNLTKVSIKNDRPSGELEFE